MVLRNDFEKYLEQYEEIIREHYSSTRYKQYYQVLDEFVNYLFDVRAVSSLNDMTTSMVRSEFLKYLNVSDPIETGKTVKLVKEFLFFIHENHEAIHSPLLKRLKYGEA